jgi:hypothetical protein
LRCLGTRAALPFSYTTRVGLTLPDFGYIPPAIEFLSRYMRVGETNIANEDQLLFVKRIQ